MTHSDPEFVKAWFIPAFPLIGFLINGFLGPNLGKKLSGSIGTLMVFLSFIVGLTLFNQTSHDGASHFATLAPWFVVPGFNGSAPLVVNFELLIDHLSLLMVLIITGVGGLIHLYSTGYMAKDEGYSRFFTYLNLFIFFMLLLVLGNNMLLMFVGWEGVGLCSYLLIGFWYERDSAAAAALKAMVVNRIGDVGVLLGMFMAFWYFHTLSFHTADGTGIVDLAANSGVAAAIAATPAIAAAISFTTIAIFWGCTGKSAQIPLYTWLPDAMEGPTPVSALIHAATMVTAGIYLVTRMHSLFELSSLCMSIIAVIGIATALLAASIGLVQNDIKRVLAYSTCSQLGYMFASCGVGAFTAGMFHVLTHAFFKACLFLGSGAVIHAMEHAIHDRHHNDEHSTHHVETTEQTNVGGPDPNDPQDIRNMGGLRGKLPITHITMWASTMAIAGIVPFAGFFSKDEILYQIARHDWGIWFVGALTSGMTAFYMMRLIYKTFYGSPKTEDAKHTHEAGYSMTIPLMILGVLATVSGFLALPPLFQGIFHAPNAFENYLKPVAEALPSTVQGTSSPQPSSAVLMLISTIIAFSGVLYAYFSYKAKDGKDLFLSPADKRVNGLYQAVLQKWRVDEIYDALFVQPGKALSLMFYKTLDVKIIDGAVNGVGWLSAKLGSSFRSWQTGYVRNYAFTMLIGVLVLVIAVLVGFRSSF